MTKIRLAVGDYCGNLEKRLEYISESDIFTVFPNNFMTEYSKHKNFTDFCKSINCDLTLQDDLEKLQNGEFDTFIKEQSDFVSWEDMVETAYQLQIKKK